MKGQKAVNKFRVLVFALVSTCAFCVAAHSQHRHSTTYNPSVATSDQAKPLGGLTTLYAHDPLASSLCFRDGLPGLVFQAYQAKNRCSDLDFGTYNADSFTVGVQGNQQGVIIDLGDAVQLSERYKYLDGVGKKQGFASLHVEGGQVVISGELHTLKSRIREPLKMQPVAESTTLFREGRSSASAPIKVGHIYLIRETDRANPGNEVIVKLLVVEFRPGESVTFRWEVL